MECNLGFLDDIEYENPDSCDKSVTNSSTKSQSSNSEPSKKMQKSDNKQMVMIDQSQLQELMEAKNQLEAQKIASASAALVNPKTTFDLIGQAFNGPSLFTN
jgi:hypothetical protein